MPLAVQVTGIAPIFHLSDLKTAYSYSYGSIVGDDDADYYAILHHGSASMHLRIGTTPS